MKIRQVHKRGGRKAAPKTHEERAIDSMFAEEDDHASTTQINIDPEKDKSEEVYSLQDYGLDKDETRALWEATALEKSKQFNVAIIKFAASFDALKGVEEFVNAEFELGASIVTNALLKDLTKALNARLRAIILEDMGFSERDYSTMFHLHVSKLAKAVPESDLMRLLKMADVETPDGENPYGALGVTKGLRDDH